MIKLIVAIGSKGEIGRDLELLWRLPADMRRFKELTSGHTVLMGRRTFESLPKGALPNRRNIVLTSGDPNKLVGVDVYSSIEDAIGSCGANEVVFLIGGVSVYRQGLIIADEMYVTWVKGEFPEANVFFPTVNWDEWDEVAHEEHFKDDKHSYDYIFSKYVKKK